MKESAAQLRKERRLRKLVAVPLPFHPNLLEIQTLRMGCLARGKPLSQTQSNPVKPSQTQSNPVKPKWGEWGGASGFSLQHPGTVCGPGGRPFVGSGSVLNIHSQPLRFYNGIPDTGLVLTLLEFHSY